MIATTRSLKCNGEVIRLRRQKLGLTQDALATLSDLTVRTLQRAERGEYISFAAIENISRSLNCNIKDIALNIEEKTTGNTIELIRAEAGNDIVTALTSSFSASIKCNVEPTNENISALTKAADFLENLQPDPWKKPQESEVPKLSEKLRIALESTTIINELRDYGLGIFFAVYTASAQIPRYDSDTGERYISSNQRYEPVKVCTIIINNLDTEILFEEIEDAWQPTYSQPKKDDLDHDIPF